ncbi:Cut9-interacting protein scn1, partial [Spiromyces aspiralis]
IMLHSYSGSLESLKSLLKLGTVGKERIYFSFSQFVNGRSSKFVEVIKHVPDDRILVESDYHNLESIDAQMDEVERLVASAKGWSAEKAREASYANSCEFFGL